jgi:hypothetical protein
MEFAVDVWIWPWLDKELRLLDAYGFIIISGKLLCWTAGWSEAHGADDALDSDPGK